MNLKIIFLAIFFFACGQIVMAEKYFDMRFNQSIKYFKANSITSFVLINYEYEFGVPQRIGKKVLDIKFNERYQITESSIFDDGDYEGKITYKYNSAADTLQITKTDDEEKETERIEFKYDDKSRLIEKIYFYKGKSSKIDLFLYDAKGNLTEFQHQVENIPEYSVQYTYDDNKREIGWQRYDKKGYMSLKAISNYNEKGLITDSTFYYEDEADLIVSFEYDDKGRLISRIERRGDGDLFSKKEYQYNFQGQLVEEKIYDSYDVMIEMYSLNYNKDGQVKDIHKYGEREFLEEIWRFKYHINGLIRHEQQLNKVEVPKFIKKYEYEPPQN